MGLLDSILSNVLGGAAGQSPLGGVLGSILGGGKSTVGGQPGLSGLIEAFQRAGLGHVVQSWVGNGANQPVDPQSLNQVFGHDQVDQWSQQTGLSHDDLLAQLSHILPHAVDQATPGGTMPAGTETATTGAAQGESPFDAPGFDMPPR